MGVQSLRESGYRIDPGGQQMTILFSAVLILLRRVTINHGGNRKEIRN